MNTLDTFVRESNLIEGITRRPLRKEILAHEALFQLPYLTVTTVNDFQSVIAPGKPLRDRLGMNVYVGNYVAPFGAPEIRTALAAILFDAIRNPNPWATHLAFENLHPYLDGNGRTGRAIWAWQMFRVGQAPFALPFLHRFYYQTLENQPVRTNDDRRGEARGDLSPENNNNPKTESDSDSSTVSTGHPVELSANGSVGGNEEDR